MLNQLLFTPGPVPLLPDIATAGAHVEVYHQSDAFAPFVHSLSMRLQRVLLSEHPPLMLSGSAMTGLDAAAASIQRPTDAVLVLHHGRFGERLLDIARLYSGSVSTLSAPWGETITPEAVARQCVSMTSLDVVWCTHSETSTGVSLDLAAISSVIRQYHPNALICVDVVTSAAIQELHTASWGLDVVVTGIQKGLCCSPGLAVVALSSRALERVREPHALYTLDLARVEAHLRSGRMTWTPPTSLLAQLDTSVNMILERGIENVWQHHNILHRDVRTRAEERGFIVWGAATSRGVLVLTHPHSEFIRRELEQSFNMIVANGQDHMAGAVLRFGLCGSYTSERYTMLFDAIDILLKQ